MRLPPLPGERIDRAAPLSFTFEGQPASGFAGDTIGSALYASGRRVFSRSFKYHRPRGPAVLHGQLPELPDDGRRRAERARLHRAAARRAQTSRAQNVRGSLERDLLAVTDKIGGPFTPVGFYYRTMIRPRRLWPVYEQFLRSVAGLGKVDERGGHSRRYDTEHRRVDVLVIGGGSSGRPRPRPRRREGGSGPRRRRAGGGSRRTEPTRCSRLPARSAIYEGGLVPVDAGNRPLPDPGRPDRRRDRRRRAAARLPGQRPRRRDAAVARSGGSSTSGRSARRRRAVVVGADAESLAVTDQLERAGVQCARGRRPARDEPGDARGVRARRARLAR